MTIATEVSKNRYVGNGVTADFGYQFKVFTSNEIKVVIADSKGIERELKENTDYQITGVGKKDGGIVKLVKPLIDGYSIVIFRHLKITQPTSFRNQGKFYAETHEDSFDRNIMIVQQQQRDLDRAVKVPLSADYSPDELIVEIKKDALRAEIARDESVIAKDEAQNIADKFGDVDHAIDIAVSSASAAKTSEINSELSAARAEEAAGSAAIDVNLFDSVEDGMQATTDGEYFRVWKPYPSGLSFVFYKNNNGTPQELTNYPSSFMVVKNSNDITGLQDLFMQPNMFYDHDYRKHKAAFSTTGVKDTYNGDYINSSFSSIEVINLDYSPALKLTSTSTSQPAFTSYAVNIEDIGLVAGDLFTIGLRFVDKKGGSNTVNDFIYLQQLNESGNEIIASRLTIPMPEAKTPFEPIEIFRTVILNESCKKIRLLTQVSSSSNTVTLDRHLFVKGEVSSYRPPAQKYLDGIKTPWMGSVEQNSASVDNVFSQRNIWFDDDYSLVSDDAIRVTDPLGGVYLKSSFAKVARVSRDTGFGFSLSSTSGVSTLQFVTNISSSGLSRGEYITWGYRVLNKIGDSNESDKVSLIQYDKNNIEINGTTVNKYIPSRKDLNPPEQVVTVTKLSDNCHSIRLVFSVSSNESAVEIDHVLLADGIVPGYRPSSNKYLFNLMSDKLEPYSNHVSSFNELFVSPNIWYDDNFNILSSGLNASDEYGGIYSFNNAETSRYTANGVRITSKNTSSANVIYDIESEQFQNIGLMKGRVSTFGVRFIASNGGNKTGNDRIVLQQFKSDGAEITEKRITIPHPAAATPFTAQEVFSDLLLDELCEKIRVYISVSSNSNSIAIDNILLCNGSCKAYKPSFIRAVNNLVNSGGGGEASNSQVFVSLSGSDDTGDGSVSKPFQTVNKALEELKGIGKVYIGGGVRYGEQINASKVVDIELIGSDNEQHNRTEFYFGQKLSGITKTAGKNKTYQCALDISSQPNVIWLDNVADIETKILPEHRHPLSRGREHRLWCTKIYATKAQQSTSTALDEIENTRIPLCYYSVSEKVMYFSLPENTEVSTASIYVAMNNNLGLFNNKSSIWSPKGLIKLTNIHVRYGGIDTRGFVKAQQLNCSNIGAPANAFDVSWHDDLNLCEAAGAGSGNIVNGDGFNATQKADWTHSNCYAHDCNDDGFSSHQNCVEVGNNPIAEFNGGAGLCPSYGAQATYNNPITICNSINTRVAIEKRGGITCIQSPRLEDNGVITDCTAHNGLSIGDKNSYWDDGLEGGQQAQLTTYNCISINPVEYGFANLRAINCKHGGRGTSKKPGVVTITLSDI